MMSKRPGPQLQVRKYNSSEVVIIKYKNPFTSHKTLGHYKSPDGSNITQQTTLVLTHSKSWRYYDSFYLKSVGYVLSQYFFKKKDLEK
eukprot:13590438-Ditylum_brightwellii.AAC.1